MKNKVAVSLDTLERLQILNSGNALIEYLFVLNRVKQSGGKARFRLEEVCNLTMHHKNMAFLNLLELRDIGFIDFTEDLIGPTPLYDTLFEDVSILNKADLLTPEDKETDFKMRTGPLPMDVIKKLQCKPIVLVVYLYLLDISERKGFKYKISFDELAEFIGYPAEQSYNIYYTLNYLQAEHLIQHKKVWGDDNKEYVELTGITPMIEGVQCKS